MGCTAERDTVYSTLQSKGQGVSRLRRLFCTTYGCGATGRQICQIFGFWPIFPIQNQPTAYVLHRRMMTFFPCGSRKGAMVSIDDLYSYMDFSKNPLRNPRQRRYAILDLDAKMQKRDFLKLLLLLLLLMTFLQRKFESSANALLAVKQVCFQLFSKNTQSHVRRSQFSRQTVPNYRAVYSKATTAVNFPSTRHNELSCCRGSHVGTSSSSRDRCAV